MAVIVSNGNTTLSTSNGFYRSDANNLGTSSNQPLLLTTTRDIGVTFANAGSIGGVVLGLYSGQYLASTLKSVTVSIQQYVSGTWTTQQSVTMTGLNIANNCTGLVYSTFIVPFTFPTPVAVTTAASTWRIDVSQSGSQANSWNLMVSDGTNPFYVTWSTTSVTFNSGDTIVCKDVVSIDMTTTINGTVGTGDSAFAPAAVICKHPTSGLGTNVSLLQWAPTPAASYTLTINGCIILGAHSGFRMGTATTPIPYAQKGILNWIAPTYGTQSGFKHINHYFNTNDYKASLFIYGEVPAYPIGRLAADVAAAGTSLTLTATPTGWAVGDRIFISKRNTQSQAEYSFSTITSISGTTIGFTPALNYWAAKAGGPVIRIDGYGTQMLGYGNAAPNHVLRDPNNLVISGCEIKNCNFSLATQSAQWLNDPGNTSQYLFQDVISYSPGNYGTCLVATNLDTPTNGMLFNRVYTLVYYLVPGFVYSSEGGLGFTNLSGSNAITNCILTNGLYAGTTVSGSGFVFSGNEFYNAQANVSNQQPVILSNLYVSTFTNNTFYGMNAMVMGTVIAPVAMGGNKFNNCGVAVVMGSQGATNLISSNDIFGNEQVNSVDISLSSASYMNIEWANTLGNLSISVTNQKVTVPGSIMKFTSFNQTANDDRDILTFGNFQRTGYGLADTTVRTSGTTAFAMRFAPNDPVRLLSWSQNVPIGNILGKTMTVSGWVYINNAAFYAGTYVLPTIQVNYDNGTIAYASSVSTAGAWQQVACTFTPLTTYGQISVSWQSATSATGTNAYWYLDDMNVAYPAGVGINLGGMDLWANGLPITPSIATNPALGAVWDELVTSHTIAGSLGQLLVSAERKADDATALILGS